MLKSNSITLLVICLCATLAHAQKDSTYKPTLSIVVNPTLPLTGEYEAFVEYKPFHRIGFILGGGYNQDEVTNGYGGGWGYTIDAGVMYSTEFNSKNYIGLNIFYRHWMLIEPSDNSGLYGFRDAIIDPAPPFYLPKPSFLDSYGNVNIYNIQINVFCFDVEDMYNIISTKHFVWQLYSGLGSGAKGYTLKQIGYNTLYKVTGYTPTSPVNEGSETIGFFDFKLGFFFGYTF